MDQCGTSTSVAVGGYKSPVSFPYSLVWLDGPVLDAIVHGKEKKRSVYDRTANLFYGGKSQKFKNNKSTTKPHSFDTVPQKVKSYSAPKHQYTMKKSYHYHSPIIVAMERNNATVKSSSDAQKSSASLETSQLFLFDVSKTLQALHEPSPSLDSTSSSGASTSSSSSKSQTSRVDCYAFVMDV